MSKPSKEENQPLVLIADDDPAMCLLMTESLERAGFRTVEAHDGNEALAAFQRQQPDVVVLDVKMPQQDGFAACAAIRQKPRGEHVPILMVTGLDDIDSINRAFQVGATDFVSKPINWTVLSHHVRYLYRAGRAMIELRQSQTDLKHQAEQLARSNRDLEQFAYVASHDLQEPLRMVSSYAKMLAKRYDGKLDSTADDYIGFVLDGAERMRQLIQDLLKYSRAGTSPAPLGPVNVATALSQTLEDLDVAIQSSRATVTHDELPIVMANETQMKQLLQNSIGNAIKFHGDKAPQIHVSAERKGCEWRFAVRDNGIGVPAEFAERIFVMFQRLHSRETYPGTGIGLSICKKIVDHMNGRIWVEPNPEGGSSFFFTIPA
ncbi:MAG: response regulator [Deltaproteobacteria bacterium]|nr:response regulator [Deltaproteobacteria bacterium]